MKLISKAELWRVNDLRRDELTAEIRRKIGAADREIDGRGRMVMPGLVNIHSHPASEPFNRGLMEERGSPRLGCSRSAPEREVRRRGLRRRTGNRRPCHWSTGQAAHPCV